MLEAQRKNGKIKGFTYFHNLLIDTKYTLPEIHVVVINIVSEVGIIKVVP